MPLADRNLAEIIASERLATEPLDVIRSSGEQLLRLLGDMHAAGVVHGDVKPKNIVRVDRELRLIDLDMAITVASAEHPAHATPTKLAGSSAYAAPELLQWMDAYGGSEVGAPGGGGSPLDALVSAVQVDLWSFAVTLFEMVSGAPLFANQYDRVTPEARARLMDWQGLSSKDLAQIGEFHGDAESMALQDLLRWSLDPHPASLSLIHI